MQVQRATRPVGERSIEVIDGLFERGFVELLGRWVERLPYQRSDYDDESAREYLHFKHEIDGDMLAAQPLYRQLLAVMGAEIDTAYGRLSPKLHRVHVNLAPYGDHFTAHVDQVPGVTAIYFANREWRDEWQGETLFYADHEPVTAVAPRPGRLVLLPGDIVHRVGAPSRLFTGSRCTIAFKFDTAEMPA